MIPFSELPQYVKDALANHPSKIDWEARTYCLERYTPQEAQTIFRESLRWNEFTINELQHRADGILDSMALGFIQGLTRSDVVRVQRIMSLLKSGEPSWPYIANAASMAEFKTKGTSGHSDGYHRVIACIELGNDVEILFSSE